MKQKRTFVPVTAEDYRRLAEKRLPRFLFDYVDGGAGREQTLAENEAEFRNCRLRQRVLRDVEQVDTSAELCGKRFSMPLALAPIGMAGMMARRGEAAAARAANRAGVSFTLSTVGICPLEEVNATGGQPCWFQLYMLRDRGLVESLLQRVRAGGSETLMFTVDGAVAGLRHRDTQNGMLGGAAWIKAAQLAARPRWLLDVGLKGRPHIFGQVAALVPDLDADSFKAFMDAQLDPTLTTKDVEWLRSLWPGKLLIKGVMTPEDAQAAIAAGADGVVVSNHGGRQLDSAASTLSALREIVLAAGDDAEVLMDGGVRSGSDVVKAVALGARGVLIGRPWIWALAARGEQGLVNYLDTLRREIAVTMALMGVNCIGDLGPELLETRTLWARL